MMLDKELNGGDYIWQPTSKLTKHPDYSPHAMRVVQAICKMTTKQLENLNLIEGDNDARK